MAAIDGVAHVNTIMQLALGQSAAPSASADT